MSEMDLAIGIDALGRYARRPRAVTVGNFDGVHRGHQILLRTLLEHAAEGALAPCAVTFYPHPATVVAPDRVPKLLTSIEERIALLERYGAKDVVPLCFDEAFASLSAEEFARRVLADGLCAKYVVIGENFRFGKGQEGNLSVLRRLGERFGFDVEGVPLLQWRGFSTSSSEIRKHILAGDVSHAARLLGRPYVLTGAIVRGRGVGSKQTVPTLNLAAESELIPASGVYVTRAVDEAVSAVYPSITNVGFRPTFDDGHPELTVETFVLGPMLDQPQRIRLQFLRKLRDEVKFESPEKLREQILRDVARAQVFHRRVLKWQPEICSLPDF